MALGESMSSVFCFFEWFKNRTNVDMFRGFSGFGGYFGGGYDDGIDRSYFAEKSQAVSELPQ